MARTLAELRALAQSGKATTVSSENVEYIKYSELVEDEIVFDDATYIGTKESQWGDNFRFRKTDGKIVSLSSCGQLKYMNENAQLIVGGKYAVVYLGQKKLESGAFKGKKCHQLEVLQLKETPVIGADEPPLVF